MKHVASKAALAGGIFALLLGMWLAFLSGYSLFLGQGDCPGLGGPSPTAGCSYVPFFTLYAHYLPGVYPILIVGVVLELLGLLALIARSAYLRPVNPNVAIGGRSSMKVGMTCLVLGLLIVVFFGIALAPWNSCSMELSTIPAPTCAYLPYAILFVWGGLYIWGAGILLQIAGLIILLFESTGPETQISSNNLVTNLTNHLKNKNPP